MSLTINMVGGGDPDKTGIILNNSQVKPKVAYAFVTNGTGALSESPFDGVSLSGTANSIQYAYIRLGKVNVTNIGSIGAVVSASSSGGTTRAILFVSQSADARSYDEGSTADVSSVSGTQNRVSLSVDTSELSGEYYVYAGTDSNGSSWQNKRSAVVYGVQLVKEE